MLDEIRAFYARGGRVIKGKMLARYQDYHRLAYDAPPTKCNRITLSGGPGGSIQFFYHVPLKARIAKYIQWLRSEQAKRQYIWLRAWTIHYHSLRSWAVATPLFFAQRDTFDVCFYERCNRLTVGLVAHWQQPASRNVWRWSKQFDFAIPELAHSYKDYTTQYKRRKIAVASTSRP